jgi:hypothetical protein
VPIGAVLEAPRSSDSSHAELQSIPCLKMRVTWP